MMLTTIHRSSSGESLNDLAAKYGLSSWRAIALAPGNEALRDIDADEALPAQSMLRIPPKAGDLLRERINWLHRIRPEVQKAFEDQDALFRQTLVISRMPDDLSEKRAVGALLEPLRAALDESIERTRGTAATFAKINRSLLETHLHEDADLRAYQNADPSSAGLIWLLEPTLVEAWSGLWDVEHWAGRWADCNSAVAVERAAIQLNLIRSKLLQQIELRHRQARGTSDRLRAEVGLNY